MSEYNDYDQQASVKPTDLYNGYRGVQGLKNASHTAKNVSEGAGEAGKDAVKEALKEVGKETVKEAGKEGARAATEATLSSTGVGTVAVAAERTASAVLTVYGKVTEDLTGSKGGLGDILYLIVGMIGFFFLFLVLASGAIHGQIGASSEKYQEDQYGAKTTGFSLRSFFYLFFIGEEELPGEYDSEYPFEESLARNVEILDEAFDTAYNIAKMDVEAAIFFYEYDYELTMESFYSNDYPFGNINYAEIISVVTQKVTYNIEMVTLRSFRKLFQASLYNDNLRYLYKMKIEEDYTDVLFHTAPDGEIIRYSADESPPEDGGTDEVKAVKYGKVTLVRYDLKSLYEMLDLEPNVKNEHWENNNVDMIDTQEEFIRFYARDFDLGPAIRSVWDNGFDRENLIISEEEYLDFLERMKELELSGDLTEIQKYLIECALSKLGTTYSQALRTKDGYFDCSSFVSWVYSNIGMHFGSTAPVAADICRYLDHAGVNIGSTSLSDMKPGDLIFYSDTAYGPNGRYKSITHVAIYAGDGMIIDASSSKKQVVYRKIWGLNKIVAVARPLVMYGG